MVESSPDARPVQTVSIYPQDHAVKPTTEAQNTTSTVLTASAKAREVNGPQLANANILSYLAYSWITPLLSLGAKRPLMETDLYALAEADRSKHSFQQFLPKWEEERQRAAEQARPAKLGKAFWRQHKSNVFWSGVIWAIYCAGQLASPQVLKRLLTFMTKREYARSHPPYEKDDTEGYYLAVLLFVVAMVSSICRSTSMFMTTRLLLRVREALISAIYTKALRTGMTNRTDGGVMNLMSSDTQRVLELQMGLHMIWSSPILVICGIGLMWVEVGWASIIGFATMVVFFLPSGVLMKRQQKFSKEAAGLADKRVGFVNEFIQGIRVVKYYAWEKNFATLIGDMRELELKTLKSFALTRAMNFGMMGLVPLLCAFAIFAVYAGTGGDMSAQKVFTTLSLLYAIRFPFSFLPVAINAWVQAAVAMSRIEEYLRSPELNVQREELPQGHVGIDVRGADFRWLDEKKEPNPRLMNINMSVGPRDLVAVVGAVGSGKTTLLNGILGEVTRSKGHVYLGGRVAYVPQQAFVIHASLRDNILFGAPFDQEKYDRVLQACALLSDIALLPNGDLTEIGERGINISGGQKQRVSLARAAYMEGADIILLDDPLSAVDAHVAKTIFDECINGLMRNKCRVFVTHTLQFLPHCDRVVVLKEAHKEGGDKIEGSFTVGMSGTYQHLLANEREFQELIETFNKGKEEMKKGTEETQDDKKQDEKKSDTAAPKQEASGDEKAKKGKLVDEEERERGEVSAEVVKAYYLSGANPLFVFFVFFLFLLVQASASMADFWLSWWTDDMQARNLKYSVTIYLVAYAAFGIGSALFVFGRSSAIANFGVRASRVLHEQLLSVMLRRSMSFYDRTPVGRIVNRFTKDLYEMDTLIPQWTEHFTATMVSVIGAIVVISVNAPINLAVFAVLSVFYYYIQHYYRKSSRELQRLDSLTKTPIFTHFSETLSGVASIRALKLQEQYIATNQARTDDNVACWFHSQTATSWLRLRLDTIGAIVVLASSLLGVASTDIGMEVSSGDLGLMITYAINGTNFLNWAVMMLTMLETAFNAVERIRHYSQESQLEQWEAKDPSIGPKVKAMGWPVAGRIELKNVSMRYRDDLPLVLDNVNLSIPAGSRVGVVGRTGSGKSSFLLTLFRMVEPCSGSIAIDGVNILDMGLTDLRSRLAIIPQEPVLFKGTMRHNLDPFKQYADNQIWAALEYTQLKAAVSAMSGGLSAPVEEGGKNLSVGQRQLLCLARALLRNTKVICLDEATANVDIETDAVIQDVVRDKFRGATVLTIAHRINTIMDYDYVLVMDAGHVAEFDNPMILKNKEGSLFGSLVRTHAAQH